MHIEKSAQRSAPDNLLSTMANYTADFDVKSSDIAMQTAHYCLFDSLGCGLLALRYPACTKLLGPVVPGANLPGGAKVPGTAYELDPVTAAFNIGAMIRWLDYNDTWLAAEWGHPSDNLGAILACADYISRNNMRQGRKPLLMQEVLEAAIKAHELQGVLALENSFNRVGLDHVMLVRIASAAVSMLLLGGTKAEILDVLTHAWIDGCSLRTYRHAPNTGPRKSWAAGDASSRGVRLALIVLKGEIGYPSALSAKTWGFQDVLFKGLPLVVKQDFGTYVMENLLFKISYPAEFHAQTAVECAIKLHPQVKGKWDEIEKIILTTQESAVRIIDKVGPLHNPADRDHCLQYMVAVPLLKGSLSAQDYEDSVASDPRIDALRQKMTVVEDPAMSADYLDPQKRSIANGVQVFFKDGSKTENITIHYPIGHKNRRQEGIPLLVEKYKQNFQSALSAKKCNALFDLAENPEKLKATAVPDFLDMLALA